MPEVSSVVAICDSRSKAEETLADFQAAEFDMTKISLVGDSKTGRVFVVCDDACFRLAGGLSRRPSRALRTRRRKPQAPPLNGFGPGSPSMPLVGA
ncbi:MAG TPA: hypothetical protein VFL79_03450 [Terriglobia bacterium]|nr:hypothetical protein [Terriglobia bacterium]